MLMLFSAIKVATSARICKRKHEKKIIVVTVSGHGHFDLSAYHAYHNNKLVDYNHPDAAIKKAMAYLPCI
jgi:tryptophan synthase beta chain